MCGPDRSYGDQEGTGQDSTDAPGIEIEQKTFFTDEVVLEHLLGNYKARDHKEDINAYKPTLYKGGEEVTSNNE